MTGRLEEETGGHGGWSRGSEGREEGDQVLQSRGTWWTMAVTLKETGSLGRLCTEEQHEVGAPSDAAQGRGCGEQCGSWRPVGVLLPQPREGALADLSGSGRRGARNGPDLSIS